MRDMHLSEKLLTILACPACESRPKMELIDGSLQCIECGRVYPIENGTPIMLTDKAAVPDKSEEG